MSLSLKTVAEASAEIAATRSRKQKTAILTRCLSACGPSNLQVVTSWLSGELIQGRIGLGPSILRDIASEPAAAEASLSVSDVNRVMDKLASLRGKGSLQQRRQWLGELMRAAVHDEQRFLLKLMMGDLRQGALDGVMIEAIATAADIDIDIVRQAVMLSGDIAAVAGVALTDGEAGLACFRLRVDTPVHPMLAQSTENVTSALNDLGAAGFEYKLDGVRVQVHRAGDQVRIYSRQLNEVSSRLPEIVAAVRELDVQSLILDGEVIALRDDGRPHPFQVTMRRFGRQLDVDAVREELPLSVFFFDCLHLDGQDLIALSGSERIDALQTLLPEHLRVARIVTDDPGTAQDFMRQALAAGHEGLMAKSLRASYAAGSRGASWLKIKPVHTLDLVVLAAEWGSGRRRGWLSNLHLGARDQESDEFVMLGKTFKGLTDQTLAWQTEKLLQREVRREGHIVYVRPELVVEIAFNGVQTSPQYPAGLALRFARVRQYRDDKTAADADTIGTVRAIHDGFVAAEG